ncbi:sigma factor-like helix-turn-helix DNA-binding protein [Arthrobacter sp. OV608]|uniref:sigma factor-like helix-turn-helix DNA-binding protein n=1 Tax=Arthrobacter sp. OV608 TaxID=1882768 RepID=UPI0008AE6875|nr:sigma factor-like helix-turn-helix DNA-binding protein [Arthrobacter sp. OV608]SEQ04366.1 Sigma-70, region 4 [Arthrobacter sp. OV608]
MTTTPELSREQRDAAMVERYADGETLDAIGQSFGITRERVRQIIAKVGGTNAEESRRNRIAAREAATKAAHETFLAEYGDLARQMAKRGVTRPDAVLKLQALYPAIDVDLAEEALKGSSVLFSKAQVDDIFSQEALAAGIWFLLGSDRNLAPDREWAAVNLDLSLMSELRAALESAEASADDVATILGVIGAAQKHVTKDPTTSITGARYQELRDELVVAFGLVSRQGAFPWPPTRQTVMKRFGGWNEALEAMGIGTTKQGRSKGLLKFTREEYDDAVSDFCFHAAAAETNATYAAYDDWVKQELAAGRSRPSGASVRNIYGTWADALRSVKG